MLISRQNQEWVFHSPTFVSDISNPNLTTSPWSGHRYFAYDLISFLCPETIVELGTHYGCSLFCFAQAIKDNELPTSLIAVDTWEGDDHAGFYDNSVFELVKETIADHFQYIDITLVRKTFNEALSEIRDGSIDIIHIDGLHTYAAVKHDFDTWKVKLKEDGIVLFHDIDKSSGYGSSDYWYEIRDQYPSLTFGHHSFGLGILFPKGDRYFHALQTHLNQGAFDYYEHRSNAELYRRQIIDMSKMLEERFEILTKMDSEIQERDGTIMELKNSLEMSQINQSKKLAKLQAELEDVTRKSTDPSDKIDVEQHASLKALVTKRMEIIMSMDKIVEERDIYIATLEERINRLDTRADKLNVMSIERDELANQLEQKNKVVNLISADLDVVSRKLTQFKKGAKEDKDKISTLKQSVVNNEIQIEQLTVDIGEKSEKIDQLEFDIKSMLSDIDDRDKIINQKSSEIDTIFESLSAEKQRSKQLKLALNRERKSLIRTKQKLTVDIGEKSEKIDQLEFDIKSMLSDIDDRDKTIAQKSSEIDTINAKLSEQIISANAFEEALDVSNKKILDMDTIIKNKVTELNDVKGYDILVNKYSSDRMKPRKLFSRLLSELAPNAQFPEMGITLYAFTRKLMQNLRKRGVKDVFFLSREGELLIDLFDRLQRKMYSPEDRIRTHYIKVSRRATFAMSLKPLDQEDFFVLFRQYRKIAPSEFLRSLALDLFIDEIAASIGKSKEDFDTRCEDFPTDPVFLALRESEVFQTIYENERVRRSSNFESYLTQFGADLSALELHVVDVGWKGSIQDNLYNWFVSTYGSRTKIFGYYLGMVATGNAHELNVKEGLLLSTLASLSPGAEIYNENRALFEILLPATHGSADNYIRCSDGTVEATTEDYVEEAMIEAHVRPIVNVFMSLAYIAIDVLDHGAYDLDDVLKDALHFHKRINFSPTQAEIDWFHSISHVENFGIFEDSRFTGNIPLPSLFDRIKFSFSMLKLKNRSSLGFWPWLNLHDKAIFGASQAYKFRQLQRAKRPRVISD